MKLKTLCACLALMYAGDVFAEETLSLGNTKTDIEKLKTDNEQFKHQKRKSGSIKMSEDKYNKLMDAVDNGNYKKVKSFMNKGFDLNTSYPGIYGNMTALMYASMRDNVDIVKLLIENGADVNFQKRKTALRPLGRAIFHGNRDIIELLLRNGADPNISGRNEIPLMEMIDELTVCFDKSYVKKDMEIITLLLNYGADPSLTNEDGQTALIYALANGAQIKCILELSKLLLTYTKGPTDPVLDLIYKGKYKQTVSDEHIRKKKQLMLDVNAQDKYGKTALMCALIYGGRYSRERPKTNRSIRVELVKLLLSHGANPNLKDNSGQTALMHAITYVIDAEVIQRTVELLLSHGANPNLKNNKGETALDYAKSENNSEVVKLIENAIKNKSKESSSVSNSNAKSDSDSDSEVVQPTKSAIKGKLRILSSDSDTESDSDSDSEVVQPTRSAIKGKSRASSSDSFSDLDTESDSDWDSDSDSESD